MLVFPNSKINIGLNVLEKRPDHYHNIESVFYPVTWCDAIELLTPPASSLSFDLIQYGNRVETELRDHLLFKTWELVNTVRPLPPLQVHFYKNIPVGAGLGGGSADAAFFIELLSSHFQLGFSMEKKLQLAAQLGSDCPFFIHSGPQFVSGIGDQLSPIQIDLSTYYILLVYPNLHCSTALAYQGIVPQKPKYDLRSVIENEAIDQWKNYIVNDFEKSIFITHPLVKVTKEKMYDLGATYASMSGSGSTVYGLFRSQPEIQPFSHLTCYLQNPRPAVF